jgi:hypothetical protein
VQRRTEAPTRFDQLRLPFDEPPPPKLLVYVVAMDSVHGHTLHQTIKACRPRTVLDLRHAALFNQYGSNRETLFGYLNASGSYYASAAVPWHNLSAKDFMTTEGGLVPRVHHELLERKEGAVMLFVPKPEHASMLSAYLNRLLSVKASDSWAIEQIT